MRNTLEFDFVYLAHLTEAGLKPLSRWEKPVGPEGHRLLRRLRLRTATAQRLLQNGDRTTELLFSRTELPIELYVKQFDHRPITKSAAERRVEGFLFGYPPCCVESFLCNGYQPNGLAVEDQRLFFHWACPNCVVTPLLVPHYRAVFEDCQHQLGASMRSRRMSSALPRMAAAAAMVASLAGTALSKAFAQDSHWLPLAPGLDLNRNYLLDRVEEGLLGLSSDTTAHALAAEVMVAINRLPASPTPGATYIEHFPQWGLEKCTICGANVNMGFVVITNDALKEAITLPYVALHYLEHGSFSFAGELHQGRVHLLRLLRILGLAHNVHLLQLDLNSDTDDDGLPDVSEARLGFSPGVADSDSNGVVDGLEVSLDWAAEIAALPSVETGAGPLDRVYRIEHQAKGLETCAVCGELVNMGYVEIVNPMERFVVEMPYIALHYLQHGSFAYEGDVHGRGAEEPRTIDCVLHSSGGYHQLPIDGDRDGDALRDDEEGPLGTDPEVLDSDGNGVPDGADLAWQVHQLVQTLPEEPRPDGPYLRHFMQRGVEQCAICGVWVNMGFVRLVNPVQNDSLDVPYIGMHVLEHGAFTYDGNVHGQGRVDPLRLAKLLDLKTHVPGPASPTPSGFRLHNAQPNPFGSWTNVSFELGAAGLVKLDVYNILGQKVRTLVDEWRPAGKHQVRWDGRGQGGVPLSPGVYFCRLKSQRFESTIKVFYLP
ncbi:MAG: hypothetical protein ONB30_01520 [candidate division KSB1 bacterium]|nr:hypothetical protein [candidate division KSB1 bacterium]